MPLRSFDPAELRAALAAVPESAWSQPSTYRQTGVHHGYRQVTLAMMGRRMPTAEPFGWVFDKFTPVRGAWLSWIEAGGFVAPHRDAGPWWERWQLPIRTSGVLGGVTAIDGISFPVEHFREHAVWNTGSNARIHLVLDRDVALNLPTQPFKTYPIPLEYAHLVDSVR